VLLYAFCMLYLIPVFPHFLSANELTRWASVAGVAEHGSFEVSWAESVIGPPMDVSQYAGKQYSNKAPALTFLSVPAYLAARLVLGPPTTHNLRWSLYAVRSLTVTFAAVALGLLMARSTGNDPFSVATLLFATPVFLYGALYFSHVLAAACLFAAYLLVLRDPPAQPGLPRHCLAGAMAGLATMADYTVILGVAAMAGALLLLPGRWKRVAWFTVGGVPAAVVLAVYNWALFGSPFALSVAREAAVNLASERSIGVFGITWPTVSRLAAVLGSPSRGLLFYSPILVFGLVALLPRPRRSAAGWFRLVFVACLVLAMAGYQSSHGGWGMGSRYLIPALPFLVEAAYDRGARSGWLTSGCLAFSLVLSVTPLLAFPFAPEFIPFPHASFTRPFLAAGFVTPNWGYPLAPGIVSLLPVVVAAAAALVLASAGLTRRAALGALGGLVLAAGVVLAPVADTPTVAAIRALVLDTSFRPEDRVGAMAARAGDPGARAQLEGLRATVQPTRSVGPDDWPYLPRSPGR
jgi:hypothetical protein